MKSVRTIRRVRAMCGSPSAWLDTADGAASAETVRRVARNVRDVLIERSGRYIPEERPDELAGAITNFIGR